MALGTTRDTTETVADIITAAMKKVAILRAGETASAEDMADGILSLRSMLRTWAALGVRLWLTDEEVITLAADTASYTLDPRYLESSDAFRRDANGNDTPVKILTREEYNSLPNKSASGYPYSIFIDRQRTQTVAKVYPVPNTSTDAIYLTGKRQIIDPVTSTEEFEMPPEWSETIIYNLGVRLAPDYEITPRPDVVQMAAMLFDQLSGQDREGSIHMGPRKR